MQSHHGVLEREYQSSPLVQHAMERGSRHGASHLELATGFSLTRSNIADSNYISQQLYVVVTEAESRYPHPLKIVRRIFSVVLRRICERLADGKINGRSLT
jgi:hypothetical protein